MADGVANVADINAALLSLQQATAAAVGEGRLKPAALVCWTSDADMGAALTIKGRGFNADKPLPALLGSGTGGPKLANGVYKFLESMREDFKKMAKDCGAMYTGDITNGTMPDSGLPQSSFADIIGNARIDTDNIRSA